MELKSGDKLGPYEIVSAIGKGGMGEVWKAHDPQIGRDVAIKVSAQQFTDRFEREVRAIGALNHANICTLYHVGPNYLVMELVEGPTLAERIKEGPIPLEEALGYARQIADALEAAQEKSIVHRDLKPANIKIRPDGSVKVLDFGLAKAVEAQEVTPDSPTMMPGTQMGMILGTAGYMSARTGRGQARRHLGFRRGAVRNAHREAVVRGDDRIGFAGGNSQGRARSDFGAGEDAAAATCLFGERSSEAPARHWRRLAFARRSSGSDRRATPRQVVTLGHRRRAGRLGGLRLDKKPAAGSHLAE
jgi:serine/threonine protein kinase